MQNWGVSEEAPSDFLDILYGDEEEEALSSEDEEEVDVRDEDEDERPWTPEAPPYSPLTSPERRATVPTPEEVPYRSESPERSRSPIEFPSESAPVSVVLRIFDEDGVALDGEDGAFLTADAHTIFVAPEGYGRRRRGRSGGRRRVRGRGRGGARRGRSVAVESSAENGSFQAHLHTPEVRNVNKIITFCKFRPRK